MLVQIGQVVSGGQTGVDRAALMVARESDLPYGGWCPAGGRAEDGPLAPHWGLRETPSSEYAQRTSWNVYDSDATLIVADEPLTGGTAFTVEVAERVGRPYLVVAPANESVVRVREWLAAFSRPVVLNIAGPRERLDGATTAGAADFLRDVLAHARVVDGPPRGIALITGAAGYLGRRLLQLAPPGWRTVGVVRGEGRSTFADETAQVELSEADAVRGLFERIRPLLVIHTAYSQTAPERDILAATRSVATAAAGTGAALIHVSSDMVLDGESAPYDEAATPAPVRDYGRWKERAEAAAVDAVPDAAIIRTSLMTSFNPPDPRSEWVLDGLRADKNLILFTDEIRTPILVDDLARQIWEVARLDRTARAGVWNLAGPESLSRYALGTLVAAAHGEPLDHIRGELTCTAPEPRPRDLRLLTPRADRHLLTSARPLSVAAAARAALRRPENNSGSRESS